MIEAYEKKPLHPLVLRSYIFSLINCSQWENVLKACKKHDVEDLSLFFVPLAPKEELDFEQAYSLYRLNRFKEALDVLDARRAFIFDPSRVPGRAKSLRSLRGDLDWRLRCDEPRIFDHFRIRMLGKGLKTMGISASHVDSDCSDQVQTRELRRLWGPRLQEAMVKA